MRKTALLASFAVLLSLSAKLCAEDMNFDSGMDMDKFMEGVESVQKDPALPFPKPSPDFHQPPGGNHNGHNPGHDNYNPGQDNYNPGHDNNIPPYNPGHDNNNDWNNHPPYNPGHNDYYYYEPYPDMNCTTWEFTAQTPNTRIETVYGTGRECVTRPDGKLYCRTTDSFSRKVTVNIGPRQIEQWEKERLKVCLDIPGNPTLKLEEMLYNYSVGVKNNGGFLGIGASTEFTLTPLDKKPSKPDAKEISIQAAVLEGKALFVVLADARADYYKNSMIEIKAEGMNVPDISGLPVQDVLNAFVNIKTSASFPAASVYRMKLSDNAKPGKYVLTITFNRRGPMSSPEAVSAVETFDVK